MRPGEAWRVLGIDPTRDTGAIRRAYATALKAIDPDADPERFNRLRDARDAALGYARGGEDDAVDLADLPGGSDLDELPDEAPPPPDPQAAAINAHYAALLGLLFPDGTASVQPPTPDEAARMAEHFGALLDDPRLDGLEFRAGAEDELARLIATALPRSDSLVPIAIARFGWDATRGRVDQSPAVRALTDRADTLAFRQAVLSPKHPLHRSWRELTKPANERSWRSFGVRGDNIRVLLNTVRTRYPALEQEFDWYRVALWEPSARRGTWRRASWWPYAFGIWLVLRLIYLAVDYVHPLQHDPSRPAHAQPVAGLPNLDPAISGNALISADIDLGDAVALATDSQIKLPMLASRRPALVASLRRDWQAAKARGDGRQSFITATAHSLRQRAAAGQRVANYDLASAFARNELLMVQRLGMRSMTVEMCGDTAGKQPVPAALLGDDLLAQQNALLARALLETDASVPPDRKRLFTVPGAVVTAAAARARVPRADFTAAMLGNGTADTRCRARIALLEEALSLPRAQALPLLRQL